MGKKKSEAGSFKMYEIQLTNWSILSMVNAAATFLFGSTGSTTISGSSCVFLPLPSRSMRVPGLQVDAAWRTPLNEP